MIDPQALQTALATLSDEEAQETLRAITSGEVDALVVEGHCGPSVFTLKDANHPYRTIIEQMSEGAAVCGEDGILLYCNRSLASLLGTARAALLGRPICEFVAPHHHRRATTVLTLARAATATEEMDLVGKLGSVPVSLSASPIDVDEWQSCIAVIVNDLSLRRRSEEVAAAEEFARSILDQASEPIIVCDTNGTVSHASLAAQALCRISPLGRPFAQAFPLCLASNGDGGRRRSFTADEENARQVEVTMKRRRQLRHFLASAGPLKNAQGKIIGRVVTLADITERKMNEALLVAAKEEAERANSAKSHFLAAASHDLRQPFQALRFFLDILNQQLSDPKTRKVAEAASEALSGGENLLHALLDLSKYDAGAVTPKRETFRLSAIMLALASECKGLAGQKGLKLTVVPSSVAVDSDPVLLSRLLRNLLDNAVKYTKRGRILFGCRRVDNAVRIEIWDTGIGITAEHQKRIFDDFYQVGNDHRLQANGLGIGLSVVQREAKLLGHQVAVRSRPGQGSVFAVTVGSVVAQPTSTPDAVG